jgi:hypothetical protein
MLQAPPSRRVLDFLKQIAAQVPDGLDVHIIMDNYATHKAAAVKAWLARRPRYHVHFTPTSASWINQVERWFAELYPKEAPGANQPYQIRFSFLPRERIRSSMLNSPFLRGPRVI